MLHPMIQEPILTGTVVAQELTIDLTPTSEYVEVKILRVVVRSGTERDTTVL